MNGPLGHMKHMGLSRKSVVQGQLQSPKQILPTFQLANTLVCKVAQFSAGY